MANTTFSGPVRSENGFVSVSKNATTGAITDITTYGGAPVSLADADVTLTNATHSGRVLLVPDGGQDNTYTLPAPVAGAVFRFVYAGGAADATDALIVTPGNTNFYIGGVTFLDSDNEISSVFSDGNSNSSIQINVPQAFDITIVGKDTTNYQIFGNVTSATAPAFADQ
ncbi:MAG: hypothetical protein CMI60_23335 [Parvibaculum sp.]|nr:hypothetical protein [Parvibaculum sp.]|tara:strand:+ start:431 stop:937 length:507 start_codon:yes stop_codon:yes gene_type:complete